MIDGKTFLLIFYIASGVLLLILARPLRQRRIPPNGVYGFRVRKTMENPPIWYQVNEYAAVRLSWTAISFIVSAILLYLIPGLSLNAYAIGCLAIFLTVFLVGLVQSIRYLRSL